MPGDYALVKTVVIAEMAVLHLEAFDRTKSLPRLIDWGIQIQATIGMVSNVTISDMIIESSTGLRVIGTVSDVTITRVQFLMIGAASEDVIKLDRLKMGGDGTNSDDEVHGIKFVDCVFDTRNSVVSPGTKFFSWRQIIGYGSGGVDDWSPNNRLVFDSVKMLGHERGALQVSLDSAPFVSLVRCSLHQTSFTADDAIDYDVSENTIDDSAILFTGNVTNTTVARNTFQNIGSSYLFPSLMRPTCLTFLPSIALATTPVVYENIGIIENTFVNISHTSDDAALGYAAILFISPFQRADYNNVIVIYNDFSRVTPPLNSGIAPSTPATSPKPAAPQFVPLSPSTTLQPQSLAPQMATPDNLMVPQQRRGEGFANSLLHGLDLEGGVESSEVAQATSDSLSSRISRKLTGSSQIEASVSKRTTIRPRRSGAFAIISGTNNIDVSYNYYGDANGPSSCCNPDSSLSSPQITPSLVWYPWCLNANCSDSATVPAPDCILCSPLMPLMPTNGNGDNQTLVVVIITVTLAVIVLIMGLTGLYCFTRAKHSEEYALLPTDGWRSRLLASVRSRKFLGSHPDLVIACEILRISCFLVSDPSLPPLLSLLPIGP